MQYEGKCTDKNLVISKIQTGNDLFHANCIDRSYNTH